MAKAAKFALQQVRSIAKTNAGVNHGAPFPHEPGKVAQAAKHNLEIAAMDKKLADRARR